MKTRNTLTAAQRVAVTLALDEAYKANDLRRAGRDTVARVIGARVGVQMTGDTIAHYIAAREEWRDHFLSRGGGSTQHMERRLEALETQLTNLRAELRAAFGDQWFSPDHDRNEE
jgi:Methyl coenzyme M reductase, alpha subunit